MSLSSYGVVCSLSFVVDGIAGKGPLDVMGFSSKKSNGIYAVITIHQNF